MCFIDSLTYESASLQQNTKETLTHAAVLKQQSAELVKTAKELEKKMNYFKEVSAYVAVCVNMSLHQITVEK